jgi:hypothetical protein
VQAKTESPAALAEQNLRYNLGQRVLVQDKSLQDSLPAVVVGWDQCCSETDEWKERNNVSGLSMVCSVWFMVVTLACLHNKLSCSLAFLGS